MSNQTLTVGVLLELLEQLRTKPTTAEAAQLPPVVPKAQVEVPEFAAGPNESVDKWIREFVLATRKLRWDDKHRAKNVDVYLTETALRWYNHRYHEAAPTDWESFCADIQTEFRPPNYELQLQRRLNACHQGRSETVEAFAYRLQELCDMVDTGMDENLQIKYFIAGLQGYLAERVFPHQPTDWNGAVRIARLYETGRKLNLESVNTVNSHKSFRSSHSPIKAEYNEHKKRVERSNSLRTADNQPICWKCKKPGHVAKFCRAKGQRS